MNLTIFPMFSRWGITYTITQKLFDMGAQHFQGTYLGTGPTDRASLKFVRLLQVRAICNCASIWLTLAAMATMTKSIFGKEQAIQ